MSRRVKIIIWISAAVFGGIFIVGASLYIGFTSGFHVGFTQGEIEPRAVRLDLSGVNPSPGAMATGTDFNAFWQTWRLIRDKALSGGTASTTDQNMVYGAIKGLVGSLGDPYSVFLPPSDAKKFEDDISGSFGGVGMEIGEKNGNIVIIAPLKDTPADRAGFKADDQVLQIDDIYTDGLGVDESVRHIRGPVGSEVKLLIMRASWDKPKEFKVKRETINIPTVDFEMKEGGIAYIKLYSFNEKASSLFYSTLLKASESRAQGIVLDLRNDPGGYLEVAVNIAGWWLNKGDTVVSEKNRDGIKKVLKADGNAALNKIPTVVLVNEGSASAAEILAGALHDQLKIKLIGKKTFGKGTVQTLENLSDGSVVKITIANWVLPSGLIIDKNGIEPDIKVDISDDDAKNKKDPQLDKALSVIKELVNGNGATLKIAPPSFWSKVSDKIIPALTSLLNYLKGLERE